MEKLLRIFASRSLKARYDVPVSEVSNTFVLFLALCLLTVPVRWILGWVIASTVHEMFHYISLRCFGINVYRIRIGCGGAVMETGALTAIEETVCSLAGPIGGAFLLLLSKWLPCTAICAFLQSLFNLLPVSPLDGGRAFRKLVCMAIGSTAGKKLCFVVEMLCLSMLIAGSLVLLIHYSMGPVPLLVMISLYFRNRQYKNSLQTRKTNSTI